MKCPNCRSENPEDAMYCNQCRNLLVLICRRCGHIPPLDSKFCNQCGHALHQPVMSSPVNVNSDEDQRIVLGYSVYGRYRWVMGAGALLFFLFLFFTPLLIAFFRSG